MGGPPRRWVAGTLTYSSAGLIALFCWLLGGDFAWAMKERAAQPLIQIALRHYHASDTMNGLLAGSLPAAMTILLGPAISYWSDRHRGRLGRRIPFLLATAPLVVLAMVGLAFSPKLGTLLDAGLGWGPGRLNFLILLLLGSFWALFEFATVTSNLLFSGLVNDVVPSELLGRFYGAFRALSLLAGIVFGFWLIGRAEAHFVALSLSIAAFYGIGFGLMCLKVREGRYDPPPPAPELAAAGRWRWAAAAADYSRVCFTRSYYLWFYVAVALASMAFVPVNLFSLYYAVSVHLSLAAYGKCIALTYLISLIAAYPLGILCDRFHPLTVSVLAIAAYAAVALGGGLYATNADRFSVVLVAHGVISGLWLTAAAALYPRLLPRRQFAQFYSAALIAINLGTLLVAAATGAVLDRSGHLYQYTFFFSGALAVAAVWANVILHRRFTALGGPRHYLAPE